MKAFAMTNLHPILKSCLTIMAATVLLTGCARDRVQTAGDPATFPMGTVSDPIWQQQEANAEASNFVVYEGEFIGNSAILNSAGESHVKQIAARIETVPFPVLIEPSSTSVKEGTRFRYPIHGNSQLDLERRDIVIEIIAALGVTGMEDRVIVSPALTPGFEGFEGRRAYNSFNQVTNSR